MPLSQVFKNSGMQYAECRLHTEHTHFLPQFLQFSGLQFCNKLLCHYVECNIPTLGLAKRIFRALEQSRGLL